MKVIVAGSRHAKDPESVALAIAESGFEVTEVVSGRARGVDTLGEAWAATRGIPVKAFPADWNRYRNGAGPIRNKQMAEYAEALVALLYPDSRGTQNMIAQAQKIGLKVYVKNMGGVGMSQSTPLPRTPERKSLFNEETT